MTDRFGIVGSGIQYEAKFHWKNWTRPDANWVGYNIKSIGWKKNVQ